MLQIVRIFLNFTRSFDNLIFVESILFFHRFRTSIGKFFSLRTSLAAVDDAVLAVSPVPVLPVLAPVVPVAALASSMDKSLRPFSMVRRVALGVTAEVGLGGSSLLDFREIADINDIIVPVRKEHDGANVEHEFIFVEVEGRVRFIQMLLHCLA